MAENIWISGVATPTLLKLNIILVTHSLKLTFSPLKMDGWKTIVSFWDSAYFPVRTVSFREGVGSDVKIGHISIELQMRSNRYMICFQIVTVYCTRATLHAMESSNTFLILRHTFPWHFPKNPFISQVPKNKL